MTEDCVRPGRAEALVERLRSLVETWRADIKDRAGAGCGCYGKSTMQRQCADQLAALLSASEGEPPVGGPVALREPPAAPQEPLREPRGLANQFDAVLHAIEQRADRAEAALRAAEERIEWFEKRCAVYNESLTTAEERNRQLELLPAKWRHDADRSKLLQGLVCADELDAALSAREVT